VVVAAAAVLILNYELRKREHKVKSVLCPIGSNNACMYWGKMIVRQLGGEMVNTIFDGSVTAADIGNIPGTVIS